MTIFVHVHGKLDYALSKSRAFSLYDQPFAARR